MKSNLIKPMGKERSPQWPAVRKAWLKDHSTCTVCDGTKKIEVHHKQPFHLHPQLELDPTNFITLCEGAGDVNCHLFVGHLGNFKGYNPDVEADAVAWAKKLADNRRRMANGE